MSSSAPQPPDNRPLTVLCLASYYKGVDFIRECHRQGCRTLLLTSHSLKDEPWPRECIDEMFYMPDVQKEWKLEDALLGVSYMARKEIIDRIVPLDDFDVETAATLREHLRVPGMGDTTARYFRDKLAMRSQARDQGLRVPAFIQVLNYGQLSDFLQRVPPPWVLKPRSMAGSMGIKKIHHADEFWSAVNELGDQQSFYLLEQYVPGDILPRRLHLRQPRAAILHRQPLRAPADGGLAAGRHLHHRDAAAGLAGSRAAHRDESARDESLWNGARRLAQRIHPRPRRWQTVLSGNLGARRRCAHRRSDRDRDRHQHVGGVGEGRDRGRQSALQAAGAEGRFRRAAGFAARNKRRPIRRLTTIPKSSGA